jgi:acyl carrier protein
MSIKDDVLEIIATQLNIDISKIKEENNFVDDLNADSLDVVEIVMAFEEKFGIEIPEEKAQDIKLVSDAIKYIEENK